MYNFKSVPVGRWFGIVVNNTSVRLNKVGSGLAKDEAGVYWTMIGSEEVQWVS